MGYKSDIEIAQENVMLPIKDIAEKVGLSEDNIEYYGKYKAKVDYNILKQKANTQPHALPVFFFTISIPQIAMKVVSISMIPQKEVLIG